MSTTTLVCAAQRTTTPFSSQRHASRPQAPLLTLQRRCCWRQQSRAAPTRASAEKDLDQQLQADLERLRQRQAAASAPPSAPAQQPSPVQQQQSAASSSTSDGALAGVKDAIDKVLIADFFFVLFALGWLGAALAERSALQSTRLLDTWLSLWQWVFQPAIGVLMLGALVSGAVGWAKENLGSQR